MKQSPSSSLIYFFRSGQARIVQASSEGGRGIHLIHGMSSSDDDDDDGFDDFAFHDGNVPSPPSMCTA